TNEGEPAREKPEPDAIHLEARLINLNVKATDRGGNSLSKLNKEDFRILEDGVDQQIFYFEPVSAPINVVLLLDLSGSTRDSRTVMIETAKKFIDSLGAQDRIAVAAFTRKFILASDFTADKNQLKKSVEKMKKISGGTAFYDGMWATLDLLRRVKDSRKAIVVLTDGVDESLLDSDYERSDHSFDELLARVAEDDATIYPIYLNTEETRLMSVLKDPSTSEERRERVERRLKPNRMAHRQVEMLAEESAGKVFVAEGENELDDVYQRVAAELRLIYTLAYAPKNTAHDGKFRNISVTVKHEGAVVRTRRGYLAR
ncbi:MAG TPA: VWA domain-containing protein, partial [Blastocatellia bacterium]|nr:VWA domain-containing protein [Blastocatellia bacterium]